MAISTAELGARPDETQEAEKILAQQRTEFLTKLGGPDRGQISPEDYELYLGLIARDAQQLLHPADNAPKLEERERLNRIRTLHDQILAALGPAYEGHYEEREGRQVWMAHGDKPIAIWGDEDYEKRKAKLAETAAKLARVSANEETEQDSVRLTYQLALEREKLLQTPRGLLYDLYAQLDREVGK